MQYTNHNSNRFMDTTDDLGQSLVNDFWTIVNKTDLALDRWQGAADNGYGFAPWWGGATDLALEGFDWFCENVLRNLVAISVYITLIAIYVGQQIHRHYIATGKAQAHAEVVICWGRDYGVPGAVQGLDALCCFLLCYERPETVRVSDGVEALDLSRGDELINWANSLRMEAV